MPMRILDSMNELTMSGYFTEFSRVLNKCLEDPNTQDGLLKAVDMVRNTRREKTKIILVGNGGSSAIAEHMAIDFTKNAKLKAITFSGSPQLTTFANDYGYENVYSKAIEAFADPGDLLIAISSGGTSLNIINAADAARDAGCKIITFTAFDEDNPLRKKGDINIYVPSDAYGYIEIIHNLLIHFINDAVIGSAVYKFR